jgi:choline dehydrogenase-like flavoprotein
VDSDGQDFRKVELAASPTGEFRLNLVLITVKHILSMTLDAASKSTLTAKKELILSAGVINTPQILLLSGIGPEAELTALNISTIVDNPSVGKNFTDQVSIPISFSTNLPNTECVFHYCSISHSRKFTAFLV